MIDLEFLYRKYARTGDEDIRTQIVNTVIEIYSSDGEERKRQYTRLHQLDLAIANYGRSDLARS